MTTKKISRLLSPAEGELRTGISATTLRNLSKRYKGFALTITGRHLIPPRHLDLLVAGVDPEEIAKRALAERESAAA